MVGALIQDEYVDGFFGLPEWLLIVLFLSVMVAVCETGYRLGRRSKAEEKTKELVPIVVGSILAIMGLLLGFTMSMSVSRYDGRRLLVLNEANSIETAYVRAQALPPPENAEVQELIRQYAAARLRTSEGALDPEKLHRGKEEGERLQRELWSRAAALAQKDPYSVTAALFMQSLNDVMDTENSRWILFVAHVPEGVLYVNALMGLVSALLVGYDFGITGNRHALSEALLIVSIAMVMAVIVELDRPHSGIVRVSQRPLVELQQRLAAPNH
jgi:hypothetical protein